MTIIADSGSTKTTWMVVETGNKSVTEGLNPHFTDDETYQKTCCEVAKTLGTPQQVFFYGAGCGNTAQSKRVTRLLKECFGTADVHVETDMLGACRAVSDGQASIVGILGTGSNACYFDGEKIIYQSPSTGYILGDYGSANHVGRVLLNEYLSGQMPLAEAFHEEYPMSHEEFIDAVYHQPNANRFLASLAPFAVRHGRNRHIDIILQGSFMEWIYFQVMLPSIRYNNSNLNIVGGFAKALERKIRRYIEETPYTIGKIVADPIEGLRKYHRRIGN